ncbi:unnamed protein product, partial [Adineta steineri]
MLKNTVRLSKIVGFNNSEQKRSFLTIVNQGFEAYRTTLGRNPVHLKPGLSLSLPVIHHVQKIDIREAGMGVDKISAFTND